MSDDRRPDKRKLIRTVADEEKRAKAVRQAHLDMILKDALDG